MGIDQTLRIWDTESGRLLRTFDKFPEKPTFAIAKSRALAWVDDHRHARPESAQDRGVVDGGGEGANVRAEITTLDRMRGRRLWSVRLW